MQTETKIATFMDLKTWQMGHQLVLKIYKITKNFPKDELFALTSQLRRAAISFTSNIAEGFSRQSYKEKVQFYSISLGSVTEIQNQLLITKDIGYISESEYVTLVPLMLELHKMTNGLIRKSKEFNPKP
jgi:four helix bundle protein